MHLPNSVILNMQSEISPSSLQNRAAHNRVVKTSPCTPRTTADLLDTLRITIESFVQPQSALPASICIAWTMLKVYVAGRTHEIGSNNVRWVSFVFDAPRGYVTVDMFGTFRADKYYIVFALANPFRRGRKRFDCRLFII